MPFSDHSVSYLNKLIKKDYIVDQQLHRDRDFNKRFSQSRSLSSSSSLASNPLNHYGQTPVTWSINNLPLEEQLVNNDPHNVTQRQIIQLCQTKTNTSTTGNPHNRPDSSNDQGNILSNQHKIMVNPYYYSHVLISRLALQQILNHSIKGNEIEIMGVLLGIVINNKFIVTRTFALPVQGTETRVNAQSESYEYMVQYIDELIDNGKVSTNEKVVGWYHSHPGYDCWLSSIDMMTQDLNQSFQDPYVAIVVDPLKSIKDKKIAIGAFRTIKEEKDLILNDSNHSSKKDVNTDVSDDSLSFYPLGMDVYDSLLNKCLDELKLSFKLDPVERKHKKEVAEKLTKSLLEGMKQIQTINTLQAENLDENVQEEANKNLTYCQGFHRDNINGQTDDGNFLPLNKTPLGSMVSLNSVPNISDVEMMHNDTDIDMESVNSSVNPELELLPIQMEQFNPPPLLRSTHYSGLMRKQSDQESSASNFDSNTNTQSMDIRRNSTSSHVDVTAVAIEKEHEFSSYINTKKTLLRLKMQEYRNMRLYKDAFTL